jgi:hypothetical protein
MGSDLTEFFAQPFVGGMLGLLCFFAFLLAVVIAALFYVRRRRAQQRAQPPVLDYSAAGFDEGEMPDLDTLVHDLPMPAPAAAAPARATRKGAMLVQVNDGKTAEVVEVMAVLRDVVDGRLIVQMGDRIYQNINSDEDFKDRFTRLMRELAQVAKPVSPAAPPAPPPAEPEPPPAPEPGPQPAFTPPPPPIGEMPGDLPKFSLDDQGPIKPARGQKREVKPVPEINIAAAIEAYLQHKLRYLPQYEGRSIHIYPSPDGGVSIEVDGRFYDTVGEVADAEIRAFLQTTIQEWQERH